MFYVFHVDVNSAYLSWEAVYRLQQGDSLDLRTIPAVVGGSEADRHGIVLAKSIPAKKYGIHTGETLYGARQKCPGLVVVPPRYELYIKCSEAMVAIMNQYVPLIQRYSIDEAFLHYQLPPDMMPGQGAEAAAVAAARRLKTQIRQELGFTVNVGIGPNKLLAKMASEFQKPDQVHTLFRHEVPEKMWPLPVQELFFVGRATARKLRGYNIFSIGQLAATDPKLIHCWLKKPGLLIWQYANGLDDSRVTDEPMPVKSIGNSNTLSFDVTDRATAHQILLALCETTAMRLRKIRRCAQVISVTLRSSELITYRHQCRLTSPTDVTSLLWQESCRLFDNFWRKEPLRHMGVHLSDLCSNEYYQLSLFHQHLEKHHQLDRTIDALRLRFGTRAVFRGCFSHSPIQPLMGGVLQDQEAEYPMMVSYL
ncbi:DNA polymerase IV [Anoxynatronum sibiricum]|uniref:DNA polymerase IV n=1 Tax=Anoxynatronum sibiricum TaxID=210623 RepID=A0ABU9VTZ0_9CLOT